MDIFLSHSNHPDDAPLINMLDLAFRVLGIGLHICEQEPQPGKHLGDKVMETMRACDYSLVLYTKHAQSRKDVEAEIGFAKSLQNPPIFITEFPANKSVLVQGCEDFPLSREKPVESLFPCLTWFKAKQSDSITSEASSKSEEPYLIGKKFESSDDKKIQFRLSYWSNVDISLNPDMVKADAMCKKCQLLMKFETTVYGSVMQCPACKYSVPYANVELFAAKAISEYVQQI